MSKLNRRGFIKAGMAVAGGIALSGDSIVLGASAGADAKGIQLADLPKGAAPKPVALPHFPDRLHAFVWRNWTLVEVEQMAAAVGAKASDIERMGKAMGLSGPPAISKDQRRRSYITVIRRNWHLLPYEQLLDLLGWTPEKMAFTLREDDFLYVKLGNLKPQCEPLRYAPPDAATLEREREIAKIMRREFPQGLGPVSDPPFGFVSRLSRKPQAPHKNADNLRSSDGSAASANSPRFCYSYFALYGDPLLEPEADPYPEGYLAQMAAAGVTGVWLQAVLSKLSPFPWDPTLSEHWEERLASLRALVRRAHKYGMGVYLYLNEPRAMPMSFYRAHPDFQGAREGDYAALCTSAPEVQQYLVNAIASICRAAPDLAGFFTISGSENLSNCWSHGGGGGCPRCGKRAPSEVIAELHGLINRGIHLAKANTRLIAWDWGWNDGWTPDIISRLSPEVALMSVSEWDIPIKRGGVEAAIGEYSLSAIGPGPRASRHWALARARGLKTIAKIQAGNSWELSAVPYNPVLENVARHALNLRRAKVDGLMLGWTLGGYPSPNLEVVAEVARLDDTKPLPEPVELMDRVAKRRFGKILAPAVVKAWSQFSAAFGEFPFHGGVVYNAPIQCGPANLLWGEPTGYAATMVGIPYDDLDGWRAVYPPEVFIGQFENVAGGFERALSELQTVIKTQEAQLPPSERDALAGELNVAEACAIHFRAVAFQARFVTARQALAKSKTAVEAAPLLETLERAIKGELDLARRLQDIQGRDSRIGFEATNQYYYVSMDFGEKVLNCHDLLTRWLPAQRTRFKL
jgi:hypothetical protein